MPLPDWAVLPQLGLVGPFEDWQAASHAAYAEGHARFLAAQNQVAPAAPAQGFPPVEPLPRRMDTQEVAYADDDVLPDLPAPPRRRFSFRRACGLRS